MAYKRMFTKDITGSDAFREMPSSSQALYFHLGMEADDDGFLDGYKSIQRAIGSSDDDFRILVAKRFVLEFENGICVIKHWLMNNTVRKDRYKETKYTEEKKLLTIKENGAYTLGLPNGNQMATNGLPNGNPVEDRIGEKRIVKTRADKPLKDKFETNKYPKTDYVKVLEEYQKLKGIKLQGDEFLPPMAEIKRMFKSGRTVEQIIETMGICEDNYPDWSMNTIRMKIADVVGGKLTSKNITKNKGIVITGRTIE